MLKKHSKTKSSKYAYQHKVMLQEERDSSGETSTVDANWEHLEDPEGSKTSSRQNNTEGKT